MDNTVLKNDIARYSDKGRIPYFQKLFRKVQSSVGIINIFYRCLYKIVARRSHIEIPPKCMIGAGLYIGHAFCITINEKAVLGKNCNIHKGVTIGRENRGSRKGTPTIGNCVWIGINSTIVGNIVIGDDVLIAPNTYINRDVPSHSIVFGNPCIIKPCDNATAEYINQKIEI